MLGIDVSKDKLDATLINPVTTDRIWSDVVNNDGAGIHELLSKTDPSVPLVVEPTGRYSHLVVKQASEAGRTVLLAPNRAAKLFLKSHNPRVKSDKIDGFGLARFGLTRKLRVYKLKSEAMEQLDQLISARKSMSHALQRFNMQRSELSYTSELLAPAIEALEKQIAELDKQIKSLTSENPNFELVKRLQTIPGVGPVAAAMVASRLLSKDFATADALVAYAGLDVAVRDSGKSVGLDVAVRDSGKSVGRVKLTKQGDAELRRLLYVAALANLRCKESVFKDQYHRLRQQGRSAKEALNIIARKIAHICWGMKRHGSCFDPNLVYRPKTTSEPKSLSETASSSAVSSSAVSHAMPEMAASRIAP